jgi:hypothetical protein
MLHKCIKPKQPKIDGNTKCHSKIFSIEFSLLACRDTSVDISWDACIDTENLNEVQYCVLLGKILLFKLHLTFRII